MKLPLFQTNQSFVNQAKSVGMGIMSLAFYPSTQTKIPTYLCVRETNSFSLANCIRGTIPQQIIIGFVNHQGYVGDYTKNPFAFETFGIRKINLKLNGMSYLAPPYNVNFDSGNFMEIYDDMIRDWILRN